MTCVLLLDQKFFTQISTVFKFQVELKHGNDMLNILKNYEACSSILDDFDFYEERQKAMEERKAGQQGKPGSLSVTGGDLLHRANTQCRFPMSL